MSKQVQIDRDLFVALVKYFNDEQNCNCSAAENIRLQLNNKFNKIINHILYDRYKRSTTQEERQQALSDYLSNKY